MNNNQTLNMKNIEAYYDLFDKGCMKLVEKGNKKNYLDAFLSFASFINKEEINSMGLDNRTINSIQTTMNHIFDLELLNEEVREALMLLVIKGLKHSSMALDYITPDIIVYLYTHIIKSIYQDKEITIVDCNPEMGFLDNGIINNLDQSIELFGLTNDEKCANVCTAITNLCMNEATYYLVNPLDEKISISSNCALINNLEDPYDTILKYSKLSEYCICLIDNDFFVKEKAQEFKKKFKGTMLGLIVLPSNLFKEGKEKSILILCTKALTNYNLSIIQLPNLNEQEKLSKTIANMNEWLENISFKNVYNEEDL